MDTRDKAAGMKSAYEIALERLESQGIERPDATHLSAETKGSIAEARSRTEARLAELEILHRDSLSKLDDPLKRDEQEQFYRLEVERINAEGEAAVSRLRDDQS
jgi:hypothetical protein